MLQERGTKNSEMSPAPNARFKLLISFAVALPLCFQAGWLVKIGALRRLVQQAYHRVGNPATRVKFGWTPDAKVLNAAT